MAPEPSSALPDAQGGRLEGWLRERVATLAGPLQISYIAGGRSNLSHLLQDADGRRFVLRRPPAGSSPSHNVRREYQILAALEPTAVPSPPVLGFGDRELIGEEFFVMDFVDGLVIGSQDEADALSVDARAATGAALVAALADLHAVDITGTDLESLRRSAPLVQRQLRTFLRQQDQETHERYPLLAGVHRILADTAPVEDVVTLVHGDFKLGNLILSPQGDIRAVLDWELSSVGDPLVDLGWLLASWADPGEGEWVVPPPTAAGGFAGRDELAKAYAERTGRSLERIDYFVAFAHWRWACINLGTRRRYLAGAMGEARLDVASLERQIAWQLESAHGLLSAAHEASR